MIPDIKDVYEFDEELLQEEIPFVDDTDQANQWSIHDQLEAERAVQYYKKLALDIAQTKLLADQYVTQAQKIADKYLAKTNGPRERQLAFLEQRLRSYAESELKHTNKASIKLVNGTLTFKKQQPKYERDEKEIVDFISKLSEDNPLKNFLKPQPAKLDWQNLKKESIIIKENDEDKMYVFDQEIPTVSIIRVDKAFSVK